MAGTSEISKLNFSIVPFPLGSERFGTSLEMKILVLTGQSVHVRVVLESVLSLSDLFRYAAACLGLTS